MSADEHVYRYVNENLWVIKDMQAKNSIFNFNNTFREKVNLEHLDLFLRSSYEKVYDERWCEQCNVPFKCASGHVKKIKTHLQADELHTKTRGNKVGRIYFNNFTSLSTLPNEIRALLSMGIYTDFDIENAQPSLLHQICLATGVPDGEFTVLANYCQYRMQFLERIAVSNYGVLDSETRGIAKFIIIACCFFGMSGANCAKELDLDEIKEFGTTVNPLKQEVNTIFNKYVKPNNLALYEKTKEEKQQEYEKKCETAKKMKRKKPAQPRGCDNSLMSKFLQHYKRVIVESILTELMDQGKIKPFHFVYMYDGFQLETDDARNITLEEMELIGKKYTGLNVKWTIKPFTKGDALLERLLQEQEDEKARCVHPDDKLQVFDMKYFGTLSGDYVKMKSYFEAFHAFVVNPQPFVYLTQTIKEYSGEAGGHVETRVHFAKSINEIKDTYSGFTVPSGKGDGVVDFTKRWLCDINRNFKDRVDFLPVNKPFGQILNDGQVLNTFTGYPTHVFGEKLPYAEVLKEIRWFIVLSCGLLGDEDKAQYLDPGQQTIDQYSKLNQFLYLVAWTIKYPKKKLPFSICVKGNEGTGKNTVLNVIASLVGKEHYLSSSNPKDLFGDHASTFVNKLVIN